MENTPLMFSILFFLACFAYSTLGIYTLHLNSRKTLNRVFFVLCMSLAFWTFGQSIAVSAPDIGTCDIWRRISAVGWGSVYSLLLHFIIVMTGRESKLKKPWSYLALYLPAAITVFVFSVSNLSPETLVKTQAGWVNTAPANAWNWFFDAYYCSFVIAVFWMLGKQWKNAKDNSLRRQSKIELCSLAVVFVAGTILDVFSLQLFNFLLPHTVPLMILLPIGVVFYLIKKYDLMKPKRSAEEESILSEAARIRIYNYVTIGFIAGAFINFISQYLVFHDDLVYVLINSAVLSVFGIATYVVQHLNIKHNVKYILNIVLMTLAVPVITLRFAQYAGLTIWALPFVMIIIALTLNKRTMLVAVAASAIVTEVFLWFLFPNEPVFVDGGNYIGRIGIFCVAMWIAIYVNKVYSSKIRENANQIKSQTLVSEISADFLNITQVNLKENMNNMLRKSGLLFEADRAYAYLMDQSNKINRMYSWLRWEGQISRRVYDPLAVFPWWGEQITAGKTVHIPDTNALPDEACEEKEYLKEQGIRSCVFVPIDYQGKVLGFLEYDSYSGGICSKGNDGAIKLIANICAEALVKIESENKVRQMAYFDQLTGLPNRSLFMDSITQEISQARQMNRMLGVVFLDLDDFKNVNDTMGHNYGDELLCKVAQRLYKTIGQSDTVSRFGGDEFLILINNIKSLEDILSIMDELMIMFNKPFSLKGQKFYITASAGVTMYPLDGEDPEKLIKNADIAMYKAKAKGKNQYHLCTPEMKEEVQKKMRLTSLLYHALEKDELMLYYQPQVSLRTKSIIGLEALLRWKHPKLGMIYPSSFIPLAEQTGLINPIGEWVLRRAVRQNKAWQDMGLPRIRMAVNTSVYQFRDPNFVELVGEVLEKTGMAPEDLELEITESEIVREADYIVKTLNDLKKIGVVISIDDFGTEYSSLSRLKMLPIDRIKMDMQFVHGIEKSDKDKAITKVIISLAQNLGVKVVAEGVETEQQLKFLSQRMCDEVQGFYCYEPMPADEIEAVLRDEKSINIMSG